MLIKFINCTEKQHKNMNKIIDFLSEYFNSIGIENKRFDLADFKIARCTQCRCCTQKKSEDPVKCVIKDDMSDLIDKIENADAYVILADRNSLFTKNKLHEKFSERLIAYYYWPFSQVESKLRKNSLPKNSILINLNSTKYFMNHSFYTTKLYMEHTSNSIGANVQDWSALIPKDDLINEYKDRLKMMAYKLIASLQKKAS